MHKTKRARSAILKRKSSMTAKKQSGYVILLGLLLTLGIVLTLMPTLIRYFDQQDLYRQERETGQELAKISVGLQGYISAIQAGTITMPAPQTGLNFLKSPSCGGPATNPQDGYIPCTVGNYGAYDSLFGGQFQTTFTNNAATNYYDARMTFIPMYADKKKLGQIAANIINNARSTPAGSPTGTFATFMSNVPSTATSASPQILDPVNPDFGRVTLLVSNAPNNDIYLRVDGTNKMLAALNMGGQSINDANDINAGGNLSLVGNAVVGGQGLFGNDVTTNGNVIAQKNVISSDVIATSSGKPMALSHAVFDKTVMKGNSINVPPISCASGQTPQIFTSIQSIYLPTGYTAPYGSTITGIAGSRLDVTGNGVAGWNVAPFVNVVITTTKVTSSGGGVVTSSSTSKSSWVPTDNAQVVVSTKCN